MQIFDYQFHQIKHNERWKLQVKLANKIFSKEWSFYQYHPFKHNERWEHQGKGTEENLMTQAQIAQELSPDDRVLLRSTLQASAWFGTADHDGAVEVPVSPLTSEIMNFYFFIFLKSRYLAKYWRYTNFDCTIVISGAHSLYLESFSLVFFGMIIQRRKSG